MVTNWCVDFLILIYKKEDSALPINSILSKVHVTDNAHCFAAAKIEQFFSRGDRLSNHLKMTQRAVSPGNSNTSKI